VDKSIWEEAIGEDANKEGVGPYNRYEGEVCTEERKGVSVVKRGKGESKRVHKGAVEKRIYLAIKITSNSTSILCEEEGWKEKDDVGLQVFE